VVDELTNPNLVMGSPRYMSPEQARNKGIEPRSDVYSLGIVLFLLVTGTVPFGRDPKMAAIDIIDGHLNQPAPRPSEIRPSLKLPKVLERLIMSCLAKDPDDRPADMDDLLDGLHEAERRLRRGGRGVSRTIRDTGGGRWIGALLTLATLVLLGAFGVLGYLILGERIEQAVDPSSRVLVPITPMRPAVERFLPDGDPPAERFAPAPEEAAAPGKTAASARAAGKAERPVYAETTFIITSAPGGAEVYESGRLLGLTPLTLNRETSNARRAQFEVTLWLAGHEPSRLNARGAGPDVDPLLLHADLVKLDSPDAPGLQPPAAEATGAIEALEPAPTGPDREPKETPTREEPARAADPTGAGNHTDKSEAAAPGGAEPVAPAGAGDQKP
jgi:hypothetical protein